jgi:hypothetical protein
MPKQVVSTTFEELLAEYEAGVEWAAGLGAIPNHASRFNRYHWVLRELVHTYKCAPEAELQAKFNEYSDVLFEATGFRDISTNLAKVELTKEDRKEVSKRLQVMFGGPLWRADEDESEPRTLKARNTGLELIIAALFARAGLHIEFQRPADLVTKVENSKIFLEAKRCRSEAKIVQRFLDAMNQCNSRVGQSGSSKAAGIALVDFSSVVNPDGYVTQYENEEDAQRTLRAAVNSFATEFVPKIPLEKYPRVLALMIRYGGMVRSRNLLSHAQQWGLVVNSTLVGHFKDAANSVANTLHYSFENE